MRTRLIVGALLLAAVPAYAEEPVAPAEQIAHAAPAAPALSWAYDWTGPYVGVNAGGGRGHTSWQYFTLPGSVPSSRADHDFGGGLVGGTVGYNLQFAPNWVAGVEADYDWSKMHGGTTCPGPLFSCQSEINNFGTARARLGYANDRLLIYGTGGAAWGDVKIQTVETGGIGVPPSGTPTNGSTNTRLGWTAGAGIEYALWERLSVKAEYLHFDLGRQTTNVDNPTLFNVHTAERGDIVRIGFNWNFNSPPAPPPMPVVAPVPPPATHRVFLVFFDWDRDNITNTGMQVVQKAADAYRSGASVKLMVTGYTDRSGSPGYNQRLSERRAYNVAKALQGMGVPREQMAVSGRGENDNRVPTAPGVREPQNRRVEIGFP